MTWATTGPLSVAGGSITTVIRRPPFPLSLLLLVVGLLAPLVPTSTTTTAERPRAAAPAERRGAVYDARLDEAIGDLVVRRERRAGYDRELFDHWVDADGDGCSTREEVLLDEATDPVTVGADCDLSGGRWFSWYDGARWTDTADLDIDHLVPLAEAWDSGARRWDDRVRERFANDLGDARSLVAVTDNVNASKSDRDLREWLPDRQVCRYLRVWVAVKLRWRLAADGREVRAMRVLADDCGNPRVRVTRAR